MRAMASMVVPSKPCRANRVRAEVTSRSLISRFLRLRKPSTGAVEVKPRSLSSGWESCLGANETLCEALHGFQLGLDTGIGRVVHGPGHGDGAVDAPVFQLMIDARVGLGLGNDKAAKGSWSVLVFVALALFVEAVQQLADFLHGVVHAQPAVVAGGAAQGGGGLAANPDGHPVRHGELAGGAEAVEFPVEFGHAVVPEVLHDGQHFIHATATPAGAVAQQLDLVLVPARAHAEEKAVVRLHGQGGGLLGSGEGIGRAAWRESGW